MACVLAMRALDAREIRSISVLSFGAPRPGPSRLADSISTVDVARWMGYNDPVPCVPPRQNQAPIAFVILSAQAALNWNRYVHPHGGLVLAQDGTTVDADVPPIASSGIQTSLATWLLSTRDDQATGHSISTYVDRLRFRRDRAPPGRSAARGSHTAGAEVRLSHRGIVAEADKELLRLVELARVERAQPLRMPRAHLFRAVNRDRAWYVEWEGVVVAIGPQRRRARDLVRAGNTFLIRLLRSGSISPQSIAAAAEIYIAAATDLNGDFTPPQRTN